MTQRIIARRSVSRRGGLSFLRSPFRQEGGMSTVLTQQPIRGSSESA
jgi:hypothetical protein